MTEIRTASGHSKAELEAERRDLQAQVTATLKRAKDEGRDLTSAEFVKAEAQVAHLEQLDNRIAEFPKGAPFAVFGAVGGPAHVKATRWGAIAKGELRSESQYRPDQVDSTSFLRDLLVAGKGDQAARERLERNKREAVDFWGAEYRDMGDVSTAGGEFLPPLYLSDLWVEPSIAKRPLADALPQYPLPPGGTHISIPAMTSGVFVEARAELSEVAHGDGVTETVTSEVHEYAGYVDVGRIGVMRSDPGLQMVIGRTLMRRYNAAIDTDLLSGSGSGAHHLGLDHAGLNTVTFTSSSPTIAGLLPLVYEAINEIYEAREGDAVPDLIVMSPRRAAWAAFQQTANHPLAEQLGLAAGQNVGTQDGGFLRSFAGLEVLIDPNITTTAGSGTNEDVVYVLARNDFLFSEGPLFARVHEDVGSGTGEIRFAVFAHSAALFARYPTSGTIIGGTGLQTPTWSLS
jgi:HK97 family phage major capsid protein